MQSINNDTMPEDQKQDQTHADAIFSALKGATVEVTDSDHPYASMHEGKTGVVTAWAPESLAVSGVFLTVVTDTGTHIALEPHEIRVLSSASTTDD